MGVVLMMETAHNVLETAFPRAECTVFLSYL